MHDFISCKCFSFFEDILLVIISIVVVDQIVVNTPLNLVLVLGIRETGVETGGVGVLVLGAHAEAEGRQHDLDLNRHRLLRDCVQTGRQLQTLGQQHQQHGLRHHRLPGVRDLQTVQLVVGGCEHGADEPDVVEQRDGDADVHHLDGHHEQDGEQVVEDCQDLGLLLDPGLAQARGVQHAEQHAGRSRGCEPRDHQQVAEQVEFIPEDWQRKSVLYYQC